MTSGILVFAAGAAYELAFLLWVKCASKGRAVAAAVSSMVVGAISLYGVSAVVRGPEAWPWLLAGYGVGSWLTVRFGRSSSPPS